MPSECRRLYNVTMIAKRLTDPLAGIDPEMVFTVEGVKAHIQLELQKLLTAGLDRSGFERKVFEFEDLSRLPVGHLLDHRVRMPDDLGAKLFADGEPCIEALLRNMLCSAVHAKAVSWVSDALGRDPRRDASNLIVLRDAHPEIARLCLTGHLGDAVASLSAIPDTGRPAAQNLIAVMAIYYGALELQLIAARQKAINEYRFAADYSYATHTMGERIRDLRQLVTNVQRAKLVADTGKKPRGPQPHLFAAYMLREEELLKLSFFNQPGVSKKVLLRQLQTLYAWIGPIADQIGSLLDSVSNPGERTDPTNEPNDFVTGSGMRQLVTSAWAGGVSAGEQIAYASMRLCALTSRIDDNVGRLATGESVALSRWIGSLHPTRDAAAKLLLVNRALIWEDSYYEDGPRTAGGEFDLEMAMKKTGVLAGEDLLKTARDRTTEWKQTRLPCARALFLEGPQLWDVLPEYRFHFVHRRPPAAKAKVLARPDDLKTNQPDPTRYRVPLVGYGSNR